MFKEGVVKRLTEVSIGGFKALVVGDYGILPMRVVSDEPLGGGQVVGAVVLAVRLKGAILAIGGAPELLIPLSSVVERLTDLVHLVSTTSTQTLRTAEMLLTRSIIMDDLTQTH